MSEHPIDDLLTLHEPNTHEFDVILVSIRHEGGSAGDPLDVRLTFDMGWDTYDREILSFLLFHCPPDVRGHGPEGGFIPGKLVRIEARLDDALAREHFADTDAEGVAARLIELRDTDTQHVLLETESWFALNVSQAMDLPEGTPPGAALREGYWTTWADAPIVTR